MQNLLFKCQFSDNRQIPSGMNYYGEPDCPQNTFTCLSSYLTVWYRSENMQVIWLTNMAIYSLATNLTSMATEPASLATQPWHIVKSAPAYHTAELISLTAGHQSSKAAAAYQYPIQTGLFLGSLSVPNIGLCRISPPVLHIGSYYWTPRPTANLPAGFCAWWYNASSQ